MNFTDILNLKEIEWHPGSKEGEISICCPFCVDQGETVDTRFRLGINLLSKKAHCFNCEWSSKNNTFDKILEALEIEEETEEKEAKVTKKKEFDGNLPESFELLYPVKKDKDFQKAYWYLRKRGIIDNQIKKYKIGFCLAGKYANRIIFPIYIKGELKCFIGRDFTGKQDLRYKNSIGPKTLYGVKEHPNDKVILVEGVIDKLSVDNVLWSQLVDCLGIPGRVLRDNDIELLEPYKNEEVIRVPDDDGPGLKGALKDLKKLKAAGFKKLYISFLSSNYEDINKAYVGENYYAIEQLAFDGRKTFDDSMETKLRMMIATDYRGVRTL